MHYYLGGQDLPFGAIQMTPVYNVLFRVLLHLAEHLHPHLLLTQHLQHIRGHAAHEVFVHGVCDGVKLIKWSLNVVCFNWC